MRKFPRTLLALLVLALPAMANDWSKKDPEMLAKEARKMSENLRKEAEYFEAKAVKEGRTLSSDEEKYLSYTREEADQLQKSGEAWEKNQKRMAEKFREKASESCHKRGEMAAKLKLWDQKCDPPAEGKKKESDTTAKLAEIEKQQAELEKKKKALQESEAAGQ